MASKSGVEMAYVKSLEEYKKQWKWLPNLEWKWPLPAELHPHSSVVEMASKSGVEMADDES